MILFCNAHENYRYFSFAQLLGCDWYFDISVEKKVIKLQGLMDWIKDNGINRFVTCSHMPRTYYDINDVILFDKLDEIGVRSFLIDNDPFDSRVTLPILRKILDTERFSTWPILNRFWDSALDIRNVTYTPILQDYNGGMSETGEKIVVCSRLRAGTIQADDDGFIARAWPEFLSDRQKIIQSNLKNRAGCQPDSSEKVTCMVQRFNELTAAFDSYKLKIVGWIRDKKNLEIYGDEAWAKFYPENYRGWLTEEQYVAKLKEDNIFVLPNISATYLDAFGPLFDMVRFGKKFLHPRVIDGGIPAFEFLSPDELNDKLASFPNQSNEMAAMKTIYQASVDSVAERIRHEGD